MPRRRPRRLLREAAAAAAAPLPSTVQPSEAQCSSAPWRPAASHVRGPEPRREPRCSDRDPRRSCVGRGGAALLLGPATPTVRSAPALPQRHDPDADDEEGDRAGGDAGSEGLDADTDAEAEAAAATAAEAADFDCTEEWGGDAGATLAEAPLPTPTEPRAMAELQRRRSGLRPATVPTLRSPSCQGPWLHPGAANAPASPIWHAAAAAAPTRSSATP